MTREAKQKKLVLAELRAHKKDGITSWDVITKHRITRLSQYIYMLKKEGYDIRTVNETNNSSTYCRYFLKEENDV